MPLTLHCRSVIIAVLTPSTEDIDLTSSSLVQKFTKFKVQSKITKINVQVLVYLATENFGLEIYNLQNQGNEDDTMQILMINS